MSSQISEVVQITIVADTIGAAVAGFGTPLFVSYSAPFAAGTTRDYESLNDVAADFSNTSSPEYLAAQAAFSQAPHVSEIIIGSASLKPTQQYTIGCTTVTASQVYGINVVAPGATVTNPVTYTAGGSTTVQAIHNGLLTALNAVSGKNFTAAFAPLVAVTFPLALTYSSGNTVSATAHGFQTGDGPIQLTGTLPTGLSLSTNYWIIRVDANTFSFATTLANALASTAITLSGSASGCDVTNPSSAALSPFLPFLVTGNAAGDWFSLDVTNAGTAYALLSNAQTHADPGIATDLAAIDNVDDTWYMLYTFFNSKAYVQAAAAYIEATGDKMYIADCVETQSINVAVGSSPTDTLYELQQSAYNRTAGAYYPAPATMFGAAWMGRVLPDLAGSENWKFKNLAGVLPVALSATQRTNLKARKANSYTTIAGVNTTWEGYVAGGSYGYMDVTRGLDWMQNNIQVLVFNALLNNEKVPFTDGGISLIRAQLKTALKEAVAQGVITNDFTITVPSAASVSSSNKASRTLTGVQFTATLAGSINDVSVEGVVSV